MDSDPNLSGVVVLCVQEVVTHFSDLAYKICHNFLDTQETTLFFVANKIKMYYDVGSGSV